MEYLVLLLRNLFFFHPTCQNCTWERLSFGQTVHLICSLLTSSAALAMVVGGCKRNCTLVDASLLHC